MKELFCEMNIEEEIEAIKECAKPCEFIVEDGVLKKIKRLVCKNELIIPEGVVRIEDRILDTSEISNLERIVFPSTLVDIGEENIIGLYSPIEIITNDNFIFENGCLYTKNYKNLCLCLQDVVKGKLFVKDGCEKIYPFAFSGCRKLTKIVLPESVKEIGEWAFDKCYSVNEIVLPREINSIGANAFSNCYKLSKIELPENLKKISYEMFDCCSLKELKIPDSVIEIEDEDITMVQKAVTFVDRFTKLILSKPNMVVTNYCNKYGIRYEFENAKEYTLEEAKNLCKNHYGKEFFELFKEQYFAMDNSQKEAILSKLQNIFNNVVTMKIKGQGYIYDNQIRNWLLTNEQEIPFNEGDKKFIRYYDRFCSFLLVYNSIPCVLNNSELF